MGEIIDFMERQRRARAAADEAEPEAAAPPAVPEVFFEISGDVQEALAQRRLCGAAHHPQGLTHEDLVFLLDCAARGLRSVPQP